MSKASWGQLTAVDTNSGEIAWQIPLGITEDFPSNRQATGRPGRAGALVTASNLLFIGATDDNRFRALNATTGYCLGVSDGAQRQCQPDDFLGSDNKQYLLITATDKLMSYSLP